MNTDWWALGSASSGAGASPARGFSHVGVAERLDSILIPNGSGCGVASVGGQRRSATVPERLALGERLGFDRVELGLIDRAGVE